MHLSIDINYQHCQQSDLTEQVISTLVITIIHLYNLDFKKIPKSHKIVIDPNFEYPQTFKNECRIQIACDPVYYSQFAYQYCHELCHLMIDNDVYEDYRWFEESLCELASIYFLPIISKEWMNNHVDFKTSDGQLFAPLFGEYSANVISSNFKEFDLHDLSNDNSEISVKLKKNPYHRDLNKYVALNLLTYFQVIDNLWEFVPSVCSIQTSKPFLEFIDEWYQLNNSSKLSNSGISSLFTPNDFDTNS